MSYPVHITNIYELLDQEGEPAATGLKAQAAKDLKQPATKATTTSQSKTSAPQTGKPQAPKDTQRKGPTNKPPRQQQRDRMGALVQNEGETANLGTERRGAQDSAHYGGANESRGSRRGRGAPEGGFTGNKRFFDRKDGTGRGKETQKKGGAGKGNWGVDTDPETTVQEETEENKETKEEEAVEETPKEESEEDKAWREEQEKEAKMMTLDDYLKSKKTSIAALPQARKVNEGVDPKEAKKWAQYEVAKKDDDEEEEEKEREDKKKSSKTTVRVDEIFNIKQAARPRDDGDRPFRGGRGGGRGGDSRGGGRGGSRGGRGDSRGGRGESRGGRGGSRGGRGGQGGEPVNFNDPNSFPTLASKA